MKTRAELRALLRRMDQLYSKSGRRPDVQLYVAKLCVLEACGWVEEALDIFYLHHANRILSGAANRKDVAERVRKIYSFEYDRPIRSVIECLVGLRGVETLETTVKPAAFTPMVAALSALKTSRNKLAHTHVPGTQAQIDAPSVTISRFDQVTFGLRHTNVVFQRLSA